MNWPSWQEIDIMEILPNQEFLLMFVKCCIGAFWRTNNGGAKWNVKGHTIYPFAEKKIRNELPNFTFGRWMEMKKLSNSILDDELLNERFL